METQATETAQSFSPQETGTDGQNLTLSSKDSNLVQEVTQKFAQLSAEHSHIRAQFVHVKSEFESIKDSFDKDEARLLELLRTVLQEQQITLKQIGRSMDIPENYQLDIQTMTWVPNPNAPEPNK